MTIYRLDAHEPDIDASARVAESASVIGQVVLAPGSRIGAHSVLRGDNEPIKVGRGSHVQAGVMLHADPGYPLTIGADVTVEPHVMLHGCTVGDGAVIGEHTIALNGSVVGRGCVVESGSLLTEGKVFPDRSRIAGRPAKVVGEVDDAQAEAQLQRAREASTR
ncbi:gamma carbonic anhydrase family protein [Variovorax sp. NFACC27]|uniref:Gamma carbonic anhydrase family protein n=1 Tax=Variovorax gossypii TaxID=1679495 RepID=A0A3S0JVE3_9BURK|nr:gamma carbonic anhydrase family protein [Variovorax gossypii]SEF29339.1 Carbonic anhydrase or acetyltransferase, isoleucine patch superfamily [Variovorax sp. NFACC28]SEG92903.1 Carbonic anhydrase or acetyltransferase, isoleucine patch superfamily [Variovorax sp. NFACC29]SFD67610.1 Carbonic anhydrase or acetyltransferase, isoleucine patch superfamily [Variovorax sp. NFACC26]SFH11290.1 Carbonic anhydrase or acetyltransferase, isoleucine patch superfamily [Variovorax sp. NFACC27]RTQ33773.1 gam